MEYIIRVELDQRFGEELFEGFQEPEAEFQGHRLIAPVCMGAWWCKREVDFLSRLLYGDFQRQHQSINNTIRIGRNISFNLDAMWSHNHWVS